LQRAGRHRIHSPGATPRHDPRETEREILDAAERFLHEHPFRDLTVQTVMARTGLKRRAFYVQFRDRHNLTLRVVARIRADGIDAVETARALVWLNESYPRDALGRAPTAVRRPWATSSGTPGPPRFYGGDPRK
jgi:AcrR family transcriptional regulator